MPIASVSSCKSSCCVPKIIHVTIWKPEVVLSAPTNNKPIILTIKKYLYVPAL